MNFIDYETIDPALKDDEYYFRFIDIVKENRAYYGNKCDVLLDKVRDKYGYCALDIANALDVNPTALTRVRKSGFIAGPQLLSSLCFSASQKVGSSREGDGGIHAPHAEEDS